MSKSSAARARWLRCDNGNCIIAAPPLPLRRILHRQARASVIWVGDVDGLGSCLQNKMPDKGRDHAHLSRDNQSKNIDHHGWAL
jgi:hypothetical protein